MAKNLAVHLGCPDVYYNIAMASYLDLDSDGGTVLIIHCDRKSTKITSTASAYRTFELLNEAIPQMFNLRKLMLRAPLGRLTNAGYIEHLGVVVARQEPIVLPHVPPGIKTLELLDPVDVNDLIASPYDVELIKVKFTNAKISWNKFISLLAKFKGAAFWDGSIEHDWSIVRPPKNKDHVDPHYALKYYLQQRRFL